MPDIEKIKQELLPQLGYQPDEIKSFDSIEPVRTLEFPTIPSSATGLAPFIDHTILKADALPVSIYKLCDEAAEYRFASVCINPVYVELAKNQLEDSSVKVCTVVGFPLGATTEEAKAFETQSALKDGADEIDMVIPIGLLKSGMYTQVYEEILMLKRICGESLLKVIIETCYLTDEEKVKACLIAKAAQADYVKTSTGFGPRGAEVEDVKLMRSVVGPKFGVKAAGGIRDSIVAMAMVEAGATRIGASAGVSIVTGE